MIRIVGDVNFTDGFFDTGFGIGSEIEKGQDPFKYIDRLAHDVWFGNFECVVSQVSNKEGIYNKQFILSPDKMLHIKHLDYYNVANNHIMQHGREAFERTLQYIESKGSKYVGSEDSKSIFFTHQRKKVGIVSFSQREEKYSADPLYWYNPEYFDIELEYNKISSSDFKIAYIHWGIEYINRPYVDQKKFAHWLIDLGFDLIVGLHPHVLQGYEVYKGKHIFYSLGNFVFNMPLESTRYSAVLNVNLDSEVAEISYDYVNIGKDNFPQIIDTLNVPDKFKFEYLNTRLNLEQENELYFEEVFNHIKKNRKANHLTLIKSLHKFKIGDVMSVFFDFIKRRL